jgi:hypothetical protein
VTWDPYRPRIYISVAVRRAVTDRAGGVCEWRLPGCLHDQRLEWHHVIGWAEWTGQAEQFNSEENLLLLCACCHLRESKAQAARGRARASSGGRYYRRRADRWKLEPERHPGLKW